MIAMKVFFIALNFFSFTFQSSTFNRRSSFISNSFSNSDTAALYEVEEVVDPETQKICEICFSSVNLSDCLQCCTNSHSLHAACFQKIICLPCDYQRKCPICREQLISSIDELLELIINTSDPASALWKIIKSHLIIFKQINPILISSLNWIEIFREIVLRGTTAHLESFLQLDVVDINCTFDDRLCAISVLLDTIYVYDAVESAHFFVSRLLNNLNFLLNHPKIILNRTVPKTNIHLIYYGFHYIMHIRF